MKRSISLVAFLTLALLVTGCAKKEEPVITTTPAATQPVAQTDAAPAPAAADTKAPASAKAEAKESKPAPTPVATKTSVPTPVPATVPPAVKKFSITAQNWSFSPSTITVNKGDKVELSIKSVDVNHGFFLSAFNVNKQLKPGETVTASFTADKAGSFSFVCSVFCGSGHASMSGTLIVK